MSGPDGSKDSRAARLAQALRDNLRRRKNQTRARMEAAGGARAGAACGTASGADAPDRPAPAATADETADGTERTSRAKDGD
jgi:hypothetical protein